MSGKRFVSVICEYNPFHFGHKFQMEQLKNEFDGVVCILSGDIVQRGTVSVASKYLRAEAALKNGANLVVELPIPWCCSSARDFAAAGVHIAENIGTDFLAFGTEDEMETILKIDSLVSAADFSEEIKSLVENSKNLSYPAALSALIAEKLGEEYGIAVTKPNNILALEYLSALKDKSISPFSVKRDLSLASSSSIRALGEGEKMLLSLPEASRTVFERELGLDFPRDTARLDSFIIATLRRMNYTENLPTDIYSAPKDLVNKLVDESLRCNSFEELIAKCTDKVYTFARVRRATVSTVFGITADRVNSMPTYTTVLAADGIGREILRKAKKSSKIDIITKPVKALTLREGTKKAFLFAKSIEDVIALAAPNPEAADKGRSPKII